MKLVPDEVLAFAKNILERLAAGFGENWTQREIDGFFFNEYLNPDLKKYVHMLGQALLWTEAGGELLDLLLAIAGWVARMESNRRSERTKAGLARAVAQGKRLGRPLGSKDKKKRSRRGYLLRWAE